jgi:type I restriction-modification system DNA methylase subunit
MSTVGATGNGNGAAVGYEPQLWAKADGLRGGMDAAECRHVVLGRLFLKYISDGDDREPFIVKLTRLADEWREQQAGATRLDAQIEANLKSLGFGG